MTSPLYLNPSGGPNHQPPPTITRYRSNMSHHEVATSAQSYSDSINVVPIRSRTGCKGCYHCGEDNIEEGDEIRPEGPDAIAVEKQELPKALDSITGTTTTGDSTTSGKKPDIKPPPKNKYQIIISNALSLLFTPVTLALFISLPIALVSPLKALFTQVDGWTDGKMPNGPDGKPPLAFLLAVSIVSSYPYVDDGNKHELIMITFIFDIDRLPNSSELVAFLYQ